MSNLLNTSILNLDLNLPAPESSQYHDSPLSNLQPISTPSDLAAYIHRAGTSTTADLRSPGATSGKVQLSSEQNRTALAQERLKPSKNKQKLVPVPPKYRLLHEDGNTRIKANTLSKRRYGNQLVPVPPEYWCGNEDEHTRIRIDTLRKRKRSRELVPVPLACRRDNENEHTRIKLDTLSKRKLCRELVPVPPEYWRDNEDEQTQISLNALKKRKHRKLKSAALSSEKPHAPHQAGETSATNTLADSSSASFLN